MAANKKEYTIVNFMGCEFVLGKSAKFDNDFITVKSILEKENITAVDRIILINIYSVSYHDTGKIEGTCSFDSSCNGCDFCKKMRKAAENNVKHICKHCYDAKQESYRANVKNRHMLNMLIMSNVRFTEKELSKLNVAAINRVNSSGDTPNKTYALNMITIAAINDTVKFGYWAKNASPIIAACDEIGKPDNLSLVYSSPIINEACKLPKYFDYVFVVASDENHVNEFLANGACECNGKDCKDCGYKCYTKAWKNGSVIIELLRATNKKIVAEINRA